MNILIVLWVALGIIQAVGYFRSRASASPWPVRRIVLNMFLWVVLGLFIQNPRLPVSSPTSGLLIGEEVPREVRDKWSDSLPNYPVLSHQRLRESPRRLDSLWVVGSDFSPEVLSNLSATRVQWQPYLPDSGTLHLQWPALLFRGEEARIAGQVMTPRANSLLRVRQGNTTLDSLRLPKGASAFTLRAPVLGLGRQQIELQLNGRTTDTLRLFSVERRPLAIALHFTSPSTELRILADWLGRQGHKVWVETALSPTLRQELRFNEATARTAPDLVITEPAVINAKRVRAALQETTPVLVVLSEDVPEGIKRVNHAFGSRFSVRSYAKDSTVSEEGVESLPYRFETASYQRLSVDRKGAYQKVERPVAVSLLPETYPLAFAGDSVRYSALWSQLLNGLWPPPSLRVALGSPVVRNVPSQIRVETTEKLPTRWILAEDTLCFTPSPLNASVAYAVVLPQKSGWMTLGEAGVEIYVEEDESHKAQSVRLVEWIRAQHSIEKEIDTKSVPQMQTLPNWLWLTVLMLVWAILWLEPRGRKGGNEA